MLAWLVGAIITGLCSCTNEPKNENQQLESYTKAFVKDFGQIASTQDWRMSTDASITIDLGSRTAEAVTIATATNGRYHTVARYANVSGRRTAAVYVPKGTTDVLVDVDGNQYKGTIGQSIDCSHDNGVGTTPIEDAYAWVWIVDDMSISSEFDFNDVVMNVSHIATNIKGDTTVGDNLSVFTFTPLAAGNSTAMYINFKFRMDGAIHDMALAPGIFDLTGKETPKLVPEAVEYHSWFGLGRPRITNTGTGLPVTIRKSLMSATVIMPAGQNLNLGNHRIPFDSSIHGNNARTYNSMLPGENMSIFYATLKGTADCENVTEATSETIINENATLLPISTSNLSTCSFMILDQDRSWQWTREFAHIMDAYPGFADWVGDPANTAWITSPKPNYLADRPKITE